MNELEAIQNPHRVPDRVPSLIGLQTRRLRFRQLTVEDVEPWMPFHASRDAMQFLGTCVNAAEQCRRFLEKQLHRYEADGSGLHALIEQSTGEFVGQCGLLTQVANGALEVEIGYHLLPSHWGKGFATEAATACRDFGFARTPVDSIISMLDLDNTRGQGVAQRLGMTKDGQVVLPSRTVDVWRIRRE